MFAQRRIIRSGIRFLCQRLPTAGSGSGPFSFPSMKSTVMSRDFCHGALVDASAPRPVGGMPAAACAYGPGGGAGVGVGDRPVAGEEGEAQGDRDDADGAAASSRLRWTGVQLRFLGERCLNQDLGDWGIMPTALSVTALWVGNPRSLAHISSSLAHGDSLQGDANIRSAAIMENGRRQSAWMPAAPRDPSALIPSA